MNVTLDLRRDRIVTYIAVLAVLVVHFLIISTYAVDIPRWDDYDAILNFINQFVSSETFSQKLSLTFSRHNEHAIGFLHIIILLQFYVFGSINITLLILLTTLFHIATCVIVFRIFQKVVGGSFLLFLPVVLVFFNLGHSESFLLAMTGVTSLGVILFALLPIYLLFAGDKPWSRRRLLVAFASAAVAPLLIGSGILVPIICFAGVLLRKEYRLAAIWFVLLVVTLIVFMAGRSASTPGVTSMLSNALSNPLQFVAYFFVLLGNLFYIDFRFNMAIVVVAGAVMSAMLLLMIFKFRLHKDLILLYGLSFALGACALVSLGRSSYGLGQATSSRYLIYSCLILIWIYFFLLKLLREKPKLVRLVFIAFMLVAFGKYIYAFKYTVRLDEDKKGLRYGMMTYSIHSPVTSLNYLEQPRAIAILDDSRRLGTYSVDIPLREVSNEEADIPLPPPTNNLDGEWTANINSDMLYIDQGWMRVSDQENCNNTDTYVFLRSADNTFVFDTYRLAGLTNNHRPDANCEFSAVISTENIPDGTYSIGFCIRQRMTKPWIKPYVAVEETEKTLTMNAGKITIN